MRCNGWHFESKCYDSGQMSGSIISQTDDIYILDADSRSFYRVVDAVPKPKPAHQACFIPDLFVQTNSFLRSPDALSCEVGQTSPVARYYRYPTRLNELIVSCDWLDQGSRINAH
jgi:hypothetical protein